MNRKQIFSLPTTPSASQIISEPMRVDQEDTEEHTSNDEKTEKIKKSNFEKKQVIIRILKELEDKQVHNLPNQLLKLKIDINIEKFKNVEEMANFIKNQFENYKNLKVYKNYECYNLGALFSMAKENLKHLGEVMKIEVFIQYQCKIKMEYSQIYRIIRYYNLVKNYKRILTSSISMKKLLKHEKGLIEYFKKHPDVAARWKLLDK